MNIKMDSEQAVYGLSWTCGAGQNEESASRSPAIFDPPVYHASTLLRFAPRSRGDTIHVASAAEQYSQQEVYGFMLAICRRMVEHTRSESAGRIGVTSPPLGLLHGCGGLRLRRTSLFLPFHLVASVLTKSLVQSQGQGLV